jgi:hypothetical protein
VTAGPDLCPGGKIFLKHEKHFHLLQTADYVYLFVRHQRHVILDFLRFKIKSGYGIETLKIHQNSFKNEFSLLLAGFTTWQLT